MSAALDLRLDLDTATLDELATAARREYAETGRHLAGALGHFMNLGAILLAARPRIDHGAWITWLESVGVNHYESAAKAMRLAHYRAVIPAEAFETWTDEAGRTWGPSLNHTMKYLRGLPDIHPKGNPTYPAELHAEANRLRKLGLTYKEIGDLLSVSQTTARMWCDADYERRHKEAKRRTKARAKAAKRSLAAQQERDRRDAIAKNHGGDYASAYALIRRAIATLDRTTQGVEAIRHLHRAEDDVIAAIRRERTQP